MQGPVLSAEGGECWSSEGSLLRVGYDDKAALRVSSAGFVRLLSCKGTGKRMHPTAI